MTRAARLGWQALGVAAVAAGAAAVLAAAYGGGIAAGLVLGGVARGFLDALRVWGLL